MLIMELRHSYSIGNPPGKKFAPDGWVSCTLRTTFVDMAIVSRFT